MCILKCDKGQNEYFGKASKSLMSHLNDKIYMIFIRSLMNYFIAITANEQTLST